MAAGSHSCEGNHACEAVCSQPSRRRTTTWRDLSPKSHHEKTTTSPSHPQQPSPNHQRRNAHANDQRDPRDAALARLCSRPKTRNLGATSDGWKQPSSSHDSRQPCLRRTARYVAQPRGDSGRPSLVIKESLLSVRHRQENLDPKRISIISTQSSLSTNSRAFIIVHFRLRTSGSRHPQTHAVGFAEGIGHNLQH